MKKIIINWFRQDLRLQDNHSFYHAIQDGIVIPIFIFDPEDKYQIGSASKVWLHYSLISLQSSLKGNLYIFFGNALNILLKISQQYNVNAIYWNRCYTLSQIKRDELIQQKLGSKNIIIRSFNSSLLWEPCDILKNDGTPYKVFTSFYRKCCSSHIKVSKTLLSQSKISTNTMSLEENRDLSILRLLPEHKWHRKIQDNWNIGEGAALKKLDQFIINGLKHYKLFRDYPGISCTSLLSPHLHWGEISPFCVWEKISNLQSNDHTSCFLREIGWREFSYYLLYHFPSIVSSNLQRKFDLFPWRENEKYLFAWQKGVTGYPIVDAGMRQLWQEGYMHNRIRMVVGSFLVKNLLIHWAYGAKWFWNCLIDADLANNSVSWQWIAGSGVDASPYFRIFNPVNQGVKFDNRGLYTKKYVPELQNLPYQYIFAPWEAPKSILKNAGIELGINYPYPIVDLKKSRDKALKSYYNINL